MTPEPGTLISINRQHLSGGAVISDNQALRAVATLKHLKIVVEPGGAVAAALTASPIGVNCVAVASAAILTAPCLIVRGCRFSNKFLNALRPY